MKAMGFVVEGWILSMHVSDEEWSRKDCKGLAAQKDKRDQNL